MNKKLSVLIGASLCMLFSGCGSADASSTQAGDNTKIEQQSTADNDKAAEAGESSESITPEAEAAHSEADAAEGSIGEYEVKIGDSEVVNSTYDEGELLLVNFSFTNHSEDAVSPELALMCTAYQDGIEIEQTFEGELTNDNYDKKIKPGASIDCQVLFKLDSHSDVEMEISQAFSFSDTGTVEKVFSVK